MAGVYISYPFCTQKCSFCNFASGVASAAAQEQYGHKLLNELRLHSWKWAPETIYFGGGTPSLMPLKLLRELMSAVPADRLTEVTIECAPGTVTREKVEFWRSCGITRISLGVQSFVAAELRETGRRHSPEIVANDVNLLRAGFLDNINVDLIAGLPHQTAESWQVSLEWIERLNPPHASVYLFEVDEDSRLGREVLFEGRKYGAPSVPDDDLSATLYEQAGARFATSGLRRYEISNFAHDGFESKHNLKYWRLEPYVGFGLDAHSFDGTYRWSNTDKLAGYLKSEFTPPAGRSAKSLEADRSEERFFVGLRLSEGIRPTPEEWARFEEPIGKWVRAGMLEAEGGALRLSDAGVLVSNEIFQEFIRAEQ